MRDYKSGVELFVQVYVGGGWVGTSLYNLQKKQTVRFVGVDMKQVGRICTVVEVERRPMTEFCAYRVVIRELGGLKEVRWFKDEEEAFTRG